MNGNLKKALIYGLKQLVYVLLWHKMIKNSIIEEKCHKTTKKMV